YLPPPYHLAPPPSLPPRPPPPTSTLFPYTTLFRSNLRGYVRLMRHAARAHAQARRTLREHNSDARTSMAFAIWPLQALRPWSPRSEEYTSELQSRGHLVCRLLLEKKNKTTTMTMR